MSNMWKIVQGKPENQGTHAKKAQHFFWFQVEDIKISDIIYKIQNFLAASWASIITTYLIKLLSTGQLRIITQTNNFSLFPPLFIVKWQ